MLSIGPFAHIEPTDRTALDPLGWMQENRDKKMAPGLNRNRPKQSSGMAGTLTPFASAEGNLSWRTNMRGKPEEADHCTSQYCTKKIYGISENCLVLK
jgi:hypothetical protein